MNLLDILLFQGRDQLIHIAKDKELALNHHSKRELVESLYPVLTNSEKLGACFGRLSGEAKKLLFVLAFEEERLLSKEELNGFAPMLKGEVFTAAVNELISTGFLFCYVNYSYLVPAQIKAEFVRFFQSQLSENCLLLPPAVTSSNQITIVNDLFTFVEYVSERSLPLTKTGSLYKKDFHSLMELFLVKEATPTDAWRFGYGRRFSQYPDRFSLLYDYCFYNGWITENQGTVIITNKVEELNEKKLKELLRELVAYWQTLYRSAFPVVELMSNLLINSLRENEGLEEEILLSLFTPLVNEYYFDTQEAIIEKRLLQMLVNLDVLKKVELPYFSGYTTGPGYSFVTK